MYFEDDTLYSYGRHFPIARHVANSSGEKAILFTTDNYGISTAKHCAITRRAINHLRTFYVPSLGYETRDLYSEVDHAANMKSFQAVYDGIIDRAERCTANSRAGIDYYFEAAENARQASVDYAAFFSLDDCITVALKVHLDWLRARYDRLTSPEATAEREHKAERRCELEARIHQAQIERYCRGEIHARDLGSKTSRLLTGEQADRRKAFERVLYVDQIAEWATGVDPSRYTPMSAKLDCEAPTLTASHARRLASPEQTAERHAFDIEARKEAIAAWRQGGPRSFGYGSDVPIMLRVKAPDRRGTLSSDTSMIETSWGASFPADEARVVLRFIQRVRRKGETWHANGGQAPKLGRYKIDKITSAGDVCAACHLVSWAEIESLAIKLSWITPNITEEPS
jgi:hypothetical protein